MRFPYPVVQHAGPVPTLSRLPAGPRVTHVCRSWSSWLPRALCGLLCSQHGCGTQRHQRHSVGAYYLPRDWESENVSAQSLRWFSRVDRRVEAASGWPGWRGSGGPAQGRTGAAPTELGTASGWHGARWPVWLDGPPCRADTVTVNVLGGSGGGRARFHRSDSLQKAGSPLLGRWRHGHPFRDSGTTGEEEATPTCRRLRRKPVPSLDTAGPGVDQGQPHALGWPVFRDQGSVHVGRQE